MKYPRCAVKKVYYYNKNTFYSDNQPHGGVQDMRLPNHGGFTLPKATSRTPFVTLLHVTCYIKVVCDMHSKVRLKLLYYIYYNIYNIIIYIHKIFTP